MTRRKWIILGVLIVLLTIGAEFARSTVELVQGMRPG